MSRLLGVLILALAALPLLPSATAQAPCSGPPAQYAACMANQTAGTAGELACALLNAGVRAAIDLYNQFVGPWEPVWPYSDCFHP